MIGFLGLQLRGRRFAGGLLVLGTALLALGVFAGAERSPDVAYGVSRVDGDPGIAIHWVLCEGEAARQVGVEEPVGGSRPPSGVPIFWQIRSDAGPVGAGTRVESYVVGDVPAGFYETIPLRRQLRQLPPHGDLVAISGPPGDDWRAGGMSFRLSDLRRDAIYRGDYEFVSPERFVADGDASCARRSGGAAQGLGLLALGLGSALLAGRGRPITLLIVGAVAAIGAVMLAGSLRGPSPAAVGLQRQERGAFARGVTPVPSDRRVLLDMSPATHLPRKADGLYLGRILAPDGYAFAVQCEGPSIQIGELSEIPNGVTGSRQLIGCATGRLVRGGIAGRSDRAALVEIIFDPNGVTDWRVVVVSGEGDAGPFITEP